MGNQRGHRIVRLNEHADRAVSLIAALAFAGPQGRAVASLPYFGRRRSLLEHSRAAFCDRTPNPSDA